MNHDAELSRERARRLRASACDFGDGSFPEYGSSLASLFSTILSDRLITREWLEFLLLAGYVPYFEGIALAVRAEFEYVEQLIAEELRRGSLREAIAWAGMSSSYRELAHQLLDNAAAFERLSTRLQESER